MARGAPGWVGNTNRVAAGAIAEFLHQTGDRADGIGFGEMIGSMAPGTASAGRPGEGSE